MPRMFTAEEISEIKQLAYEKPNIQWNSTMIVLLLDHIEDMYEQLKKARGN